VNARNLRPPFLAIKDSPQGGKASADVIGIALGVRARSATNRNAELHAQRRTRNPVRDSNPHSQPRETRALFGTSSLCIDRINAMFERMDLLERISRRDTSSKYEALSFAAYLQTSTVWLHYLRYGSPPEIFR